MDKDEILADRRMKIRGFMGWLDEEEMERQKRIEMRVEECEKLKKNGKCEKCPAPGAH